MAKKNNVTFWNLAQEISDMCTEVVECTEVLGYKPGKASISPKKAAKKEKELAECSKKLKDAILSEFKKNGHDSAKDISFATALGHLIEYTRFCASALATMSESQEVSESSEDENNPPISFDFCLPDPIEKTEKEENVAPISFGFCLPDPVEKPVEEDLIFPGYEFAFYKVDEGSMHGYKNFDDFMKGLCTDAGLSKFIAKFKDPEKLKKEKKAKKKKEKKEAAKLPKIAKSAKFVKELQEIRNIFISDTTEAEQNQQIEDVILDLVKRELKDCDNPARTAIGILNNVCYNFIPTDDREVGIRLRRVCYGSRAIHDVVVRAIGDGLDASGDVNRYFDITLTQAYVCSLRGILFDHKPESLDMNHLGFSLLRWLVTRPEIDSKLEAYEAAWKLLCDHIGHKFYLTWPFAKYEIGIYNSFEAGPFLKEMIRLKLEDKITSTHKDWVSLSLWLQEKVYELEPSTGGKSYEPLKSDTFPCSLYACADIILKEIHGHLIPHPNGADTWLYNHALNRLDSISKFPGLSCEGHYHVSAHGHYVLRALEEYFLEGADNESFRISKYVMEEPLSDDMIRKLISSNMSGKTILTISAKCGWEWTRGFSRLDHKDALNAYLWAVMLYQDSINEEDFMIIEFAHELLNDQAVFKKILKHLLRSSVMDWGDLLLEDMLENIIYHFQKYSEEDIRPLLEKMFREAASDFLKAPGHVAYYLKDKWTEKEEKLQQFLTTSEKVADEEEVNFPEILGKTFGESLGAIVPDKETINALAKILKEDKDHFTRIFKECLDEVYAVLIEEPFHNPIEDYNKFFNHLKGYIPEMENLDTDRLLESCYYQIFCEYLDLLIIHKNRDMGPEEIVEWINNFISAEIVKEFKSPNGRLTSMRNQMDEVKFKVGTSSAEHIAHITAGELQILHLKKDATDDSLMDVSRLCELVGIVCDKPDWYMAYLRDLSDDSFVLWYMNERVAMKVNYFSIPDLFRDEVRFLTQFLIMMASSYGLAEFPSMGLVTKAVSKVLDFKLYELAESYPGLLDFMIPLFEESKTNWATIKGKNPNNTEFVNFLYRLINSMIAKPEVAYFNPEALYSLPDKLKLDVYCYGKADIDPRDNNKVTLQIFRCDLVKYFGYSFLLHHGGNPKADLIYMAANGVEIDPAAKNVKESELIKSTIGGINFMEIKSLLELAMLGPICKTKGLNQMNLEEIYGNLVTFLERFGKPLGNNKEVFEEQEIGLRVFIANTFKTLLAITFKSIHGKDLTDENMDMLPKDWADSLTAYRAFKEKTKK